MGKKGVVSEFSFCVFGALGRSYSQGGGMDTACLDDVMTETKKLEFERGECGD